MPTSMASARCSVQACTILAMHLSWVVKLHTGRAGKRERSREVEKHAQHGGARTLAHKPLYRQAPEQLAACRAVGRGLERLLGEEVAERVWRACRAAGHDGTTA